MADAASDFLEFALLDHIFRGTDYTAPSTIYVALFTASPGETYSGAQGGAPEIATTGGTNYARVAKARGTTNWTRSTNTVLNNTDIVFNTAQANWGTVSHMGLLDGTSASAQLLVYGALTVNKAVASADVLRFNTSDLKIACL